MNGKIFRMSKDPEERRRDRSSPSRVSRIRAPEEQSHTTDSLFFDTKTGERASLPKPALAPYRPSTLKVASPDSRMEQEAEQFASIYSSSAGGRAPSIGSMDHEGLVLTSGATEEFNLDREQESAVGQALSEGSESLSRIQRASLEQMLGRDLSQVRVHTGPNAEKAALSINARAFTVGNDVVFGKGEYRPGTHEGDHILAHEIAHVAQNTGHIARKADKKSSERPLTKEEIAEARLVYGDLIHYDRVRIDENSFIAKAGAVLNRAEGM